MQRHYSIKSLILFLLLSQFVTITHAFEHDSAHAEDEQCFICIHQSNSSNALINPVSLDTDKTLVEEQVWFKGNGFYSSGYYLFNNRSPPYPP